MYPVAEHIAATDFTDCTDFSVHGPNNPERIFGLGNEKPWVMKPLSEQDLRHAEISRVILGAAFEVHQVLGAGFLESVYEEALTHELQFQGVRVQRQLEVPIYYKGTLVGTLVLDLPVEDKVVVELKVVKELAEIHSAVVRSYLAATRLQVALLHNFGKPSLQHRRLVG